MYFSAEQVIGATGHLIQRPTPLPFLARDSLPESPQGSPVFAGWEANAHAAGETEGDPRLIKFDRSGVRWLTQASTAREERI